MFPRLLRCSIFSGFHLKLELLYLPSDTGMEASASAPTFDLHSCEGRDSPCSSHLLGLRPQLQRPGTPFHCSRWIVWLCTGSGVPEYFCSIIKSNVTHPTHLLPCTLSTAGRPPPLEGTHCVPG